MLEDGDEKVGKGIVVLLVEGQVARVLEATACKENRHVAVAVVRGVAKIASKQYGGIVE